MRALLILFGSLTAMAAGLKPEFIYESAPFPSCHASTVIELKNGDVMSAWFGGTNEGNPDVAIWASRRSGGAWSKPEELVREPNIPTFNPVLFYTNDGKLWLYYKFGPKPDNWSAGRRFSTDDGKSWSPVEHLPAGLLGPIRAKPLVLANGTIVSGTSVESYRTWAAWIDRSTDGGSTWTKFGPITVPVQGEAPKAQYGLIQPSVVPMGGNKLRLYARSTTNIGKIAIADSNDLGVTWTQARTIDLPNPNSGIDAVALKDGKVVLIYNHTTRGRSPLNLAVAADGEHFRMIQTLESEPGEYSYPAMIVGKDGSLHITYTWKRTKIRYLHIPAADLAAMMKQ